MNLEHTDNIVSHHSSFELSAVFLLSHNGRTSDYRKCVGKNDKCLSLRRGSSCSIPGASLLACELNRLPWFGHEHRHCEQTQDSRSSLLLAAEDSQIKSKVQNSKLILKVD